MKKILCLGDSNTYGFIPQSAKRYSKNERWSARVEQYFKNECKNKFEIIENGLNNRTLFCKNPSGEEFCGFEYLEKNLFRNNLSGNFFDIIILALGINDTQISYNKTTDEIIEGVFKTLLLIKEKSPNTDIILISPSVTTKDIKNSYFSTMFDDNSIIKSQKLAEIFKNACEKFNNINAKTDNPCNYHKNKCYFIDFNKITQTSNLDGLHYSPESHKKIADFMIEFLNKNF